MRLAPSEQIACECGEKQVLYRHSSDQVGLESWGFVGSKPHFEKSWSFIGTEVAPNNVKINSAKEVSGSNILTVPVAQTAIAVVVNPSANARSRKSSTNSSRE